MQLLLVILATLILEGCKERHARKTESMRPRPQNEVAKQWTRLEENHVGDKYRVVQREAEEMLKQVCPPPHWPGRRKCARGVFEARPLVSLLSHELGFLNLWTRLQKLLLKSRHGTMCSSAKTAGKRIFRCCPRSAGKCTKNRLQ
jgi:hypothetical protein